MIIHIPNLGKRRIAKLTEWHPWFAWHPVRVQDETWIWGETILRRGVPGVREIPVMKPFLAHFNPSMYRHLHGAIPTQDYQEIITVVDWEYAPYRKED